MEYDRFDLEQKILNCWSITDDLKHSECEYAKALALVYEVKFDDLWRCFEALIADKKV